MFTLLSRMFSTFSAQLLMTRMTFLVGFLALPSAGVAGSAAGASSRVTSLVFAVGVAEVVGASFVACCSGFGSARAYWYTTSFLGESSAGSFFSSVVSVPSWGWAESSSASLRVKAASGSGWLSPAASADPVASSVAGVAAGSAAEVAAARSASFRVVSPSSLPSLITISSLVSV